MSLAYKCDNCDKMIEGIPANRGIKLDLGIYEPEGYCLSQYIYLVADVQVKTKNKNDICEKCLIKLLVQGLDNHSKKGKCQKGN